VAVAQLHGPSAGLAELENIRDRDTLETYYLFHAVQAELASQLKDFPSAAAHLRQALQFVELKSEQALLLQRLAECQDQKQ